MPRLKTHLEPCILPILLPHSPLGPPLPTLLVVVQSGGRVAVVAGIDVARVKVKQTINNNDCCLPMTRFFTLKFQL